MHLRGSAFYSGADSILKYSFRSRSIALQACGFLIDIPNKVTAIEGLSCGRLKYFFL